MYVFLLLRHVNLNTSRTEIVLRRVGNINKNIQNKSYSECFSNIQEKCELLIIGGGTGGCSIAAKFAPKLGKDGLTILEPNDVHYYQPSFTLVGAGLNNIEKTVRPMSKVLPPNARWFKDSVDRFEPDESYVITKGGTEIKYKYLIIACGLRLYFERIKGLTEALSDPNSNVCTNYSPQYAPKTFEILKRFQGGNAVFTFPNTPVKCAGAPVKACLLCEDYFTLNSKRYSTDVIYKTSMPVIFSVKHYANKLLKLCRDRNISTQFREELIEIKPHKKVAIFKVLDEPVKWRIVCYNMLHVTPPMGTPPELKAATDLVDENGFLNVNKNTLQHVKYPNIFGLGDCTNLPTSKTAAAVAAQSKVVYDNVSQGMEGKPISSIYNGYTSCPLLTGYGRCIMAEFDYNLQPLETFPFDQSKESRLMYYLKRDILPQVYWRMMMKGYWNGPQKLRKMLRFDFK